MRRLTVVVLSVMFVAGLCGMAVAGSLETTGPPSAGSGMYSLQQIYDYLHSGIEATSMANFQEPGAAPGQTMKTTKQIYDDIKAKFVLCDATADKVASGTKFFSTVSGSWGVQNGTLSSSAAIPPGAIMMYSGAWNFDGTGIGTGDLVGWALCNGQNGAPNLLDSFVMGITTSARQLETGGQNSVTLTIDQMPAHSHTTYASGQYEVNAGATHYCANSGSTNSSSVGGGQPHENRPKYLALAYIMKLAG